MFELLIKTKTKRRKKIIEKISHSKQKTDYICRKDKKGKQNNKKNEMCDYFLAFWFSFLLFR